MRKVVASAVLAGLLGALLVAGPALSKTKSVEVDDNYFVHKGSPRTVTVHKGDKVEWEWEGSNPHNVTVKNGPVKFHSKINELGVFELWCVSTLDPKQRWKLEFSVRQDAERS